MSTPRRFDFPDDGPGMAALPRPRMASPRGPTEAAVDTTFVAALFLTSLFVLHLPLVPVIMAALLGIYCYLMPHRATAAFTRVWPLLLFPALAFTSILWSEAPGLTAYAAVLYAITIMLGTLVGSAVREASILKGLGIAFFGYAVLNVQLGVATGGFTFAFPFLGYAGSKNVQGDIAAFGILTCLSLTLLAWRTGQRVYLLITIPTILANLVIIAFAQSAGAIVAVAIGSMLILAWTATRHFSLSMRGSILVLSIIVGATLILTRHIWFEPIFEHILKEAGKDTTLTGRAYIWSRAEILIEKNPVFGIGYGSFWRENNLEAIAIWREMGIENRTGYNFHNTFLDLTVQLGYVGLVLFCALLAYYGLKLLLDTMNNPTQAGIFFSAVITYECARMGFETLAIGQFYYPTMLIFASLAWGTRPFSHARRSAERPERRLSGDIRGYR